MRGHSERLKRVEDVLGFTAIPNIEIAAGEDDELGVIF
jgi:hypothetical protein